MQLLKTLLPLAIFLTLTACNTTVQQQKSVGTPTPVTQSVPTGRVIAISAELWKFTPNVITAKKDEVVTLQVTGISGTHGFSVPGLDINETIFMGKTVNIPLRTNTTGTFEFACSIQCGSGHSDMNGQIIIEN